MSGISRRAGFWAGAVCLLTLTVGCGGQVKIHGKVTIDGQPLETGAISFIPADKTKGQTAGASITQGAYEMQGPNPPQPGSYVVEIRGQKKTGKKVPAGSPSPPGTMLDEMKEAVPAQYNTASTLRAELKSGNNELNYDLKSK